ncbi:putative Carbon catabolite-derepressing protein kinase [Blattamonas nauphoetae]|uniref:Carbon catabolite-derepressing protein kinase n=1 Tax=Blattamonas nauphoetae TaxID=2049346 RepID=A0ABQ9X8F8_9EUKA|nr:putative Carbon catabolite-derepressing protein kinase [Blattamonas nauphoetae]
MTDFIQVPDGYSFVRIINSGGFGTVVEMIEKSTNIQYAGKIVQCLTQKHKDRFDREVGRLKTFSHPRIIKLKETVTLEGYQVIVMELGGRSLAEVVQDYAQRKVRMPRVEGYRVMEDVASALELIHNHESGRTAHGDIKMENILMDADGHAKLCDFGAAESEDVTVSRSVMSQLYVSPERMESETGPATCEADVWSLGVVLYWLLFGEPPFKSRSLLKLGQEISSFKATSIKNTCGEDERALLMRMMDPCVETRVTCRQLCLGKAFRCIVNTVEGVWKLKDVEQAKRVAVEEEKRKLDTRIEQLVETRNQEITLKTLKPQRVDLPIWVGTESVKTLDKTAHKLTPTTLTQIITLEPNYGFGGDFLLWNGRKWRTGKEFKSEGTNKKWERVGQTAAIRVNMSTRKARLLVDDSEQPGIFTNIPSPLCLAISTHVQNAAIDIIHLVRTDMFKTELEKQHALSMSSAWVRNVGPSSPTSI